MYYNFSGHLQKAETTVRIEAQEITQRDSFCYFSLVICSDGEIDEDIKRRIKVGLLKLRLASRVLCDQQISTKLQERFYKTVIVPRL